MRIRKAIVLMLTLALVLGSMVEVFASTSYGKASVITLEKFTGTVTVTNASGKKVTTRTGMRIYSGYTIATETESNAYISLDSTKALMLESASKMKLKKAGNKIDVMLENGTVVTDISDSLENDESMDIHTTNTVTGIRGTGVEVSYFGPFGATRICMLDGLTSSYYKFDSVAYYVGAGHGIDVGGGAATVTPIGDALTVSDLQPETQKLMVIDGGISDEVYEGFSESFGLDGMSDEDVEDLAEAIEALNESKTEEDKKADGDAAEEIDGIVETAEENEAEYGVKTVDPVFEDQNAATGTGAVEGETGGGTTTIPDNSGSGSSGSGSSSETQTTEAVSVTLPEGGAFASVFALVGGEMLEGPSTVTLTPEDTVFWVNYEDGNSFTIDSVTAYVSSTQLSEVDPPSLYQGSGGKFFSKSTLPENGGAFTAQLEITLAKLSDDSQDNQVIFSMIDSVNSMDAFTSATVHYDSSDLDALNEKMKYDKFSWVPYQGSGSGSGGSSDEINITVPTSSFFTVAASVGSETLSGTQTNSGTVYTTTASSITFTLIPAMINERHYDISDMGLGTSGVSNTLSLDDNGNHVFTVTDYDEDFTLQFNIGVIMVDPETGVIDSDQQNTISQVVAGMESNLFASKTLYIPEGFTQEDLAQFATISTVTVKNYYIVEFLDADFPNTSSRQTFSYRDSIRKPDPGTQPDQEFVDDKQQAWDLTFTDWVRYDEPSDSYIPYDPADDITQGLTFYARYTDRNTNTQVIPYLN